MTEPQKAPGATAAAVQAATVAAAGLRSPTGSPLRVKVIAPFRCCHEGKSYVGGQTATVPAETANHWITNKWAALVPARSKPSQKGK